MLSEIAEILSREDGFKKCLAIVVTTSSISRRQCGARPLEAVSIHLAHHFISRAITF